MELIQEICFRVLEIFILILGITGLVVSFLLIVSPKLTRSLSKLLDQKISFDKKITYLNKSIVTDKLTYRYNIPSGLALIAGSIFLFIFLFFQLDLLKVVDLFSVPNYSFLIEIIVRVLAMVGKIAAVLGFIFGFFLLFAPEMMIKIENKMDSWFATDYMVDKLDEFHHGIEDLILKYPLLFGFACLMTSVILILLSIVSILS